MPAAIAASQALLGDPRLGIAVFQGLIYAVLVVARGSTGARVYGAHTAVWSAALVALNPALGFYAAQALTEFLTGALLVAVVAAIVAWAARPRWSLMVLSGVLIGATGYLRSEYLGLALVFALVVVVLGAARKGCSRRGC